MQKPTVNKWYPIKIWLTTIILLGPLAVSIYSIAEDSYYDKGEILSQALLFMLYGLVFSLPILGICYFFFKITTRKQMPGFLVKAITDSLCLLGVFITLKYVAPYAKLSLTLIYSASVIMSSLFYKVYNGTEK